MRLIRSWPEQVPPGRAYVQDAIERLVLADYDYAPLADVDDDVVLVEWDVAVDGDDLARFVDHARAQPDRVLVAPYRLYVTTVRNVELRQPVWCHRRADGTHIDTDEPTCAYFGFGLIYLPRTIVQGFRREWTGHFSDGSFGGWHRRRVTEQVPIAWDVRPAHLHYNIGPLTGLDQPTPTQPTRKVTVMPDVDPNDPAREAWLAHPARKREIEALLLERAGLIRQGKTDRIAAVDEQLVLRGYSGDAAPAPEAGADAQGESEQDPDATQDQEPKPAKTTPPKGRGSRPRQQASE